LHERTAQAIEKLYYHGLEDHYNELAHHYGRSGNAGKAVEYLGLAGRQALERYHHCEAYIVAHDGRRLGAWSGRRTGRGCRIVERIDQLARAPFHFASPQVVETDGRRDADQPTIQPVLVRQSTFALEGASNRLLTQIVRIVAAAGHAVAQAPQPFPVALDGGEQGT
jgi:hypothetical protein